MSLPRISTLRSLAVLYFIVIAIGLSLIAQGSIYKIGPDGVAYISIAQHYVDGYWKEAINAYWSPMLSWLLAPFVALGIDGEVAFRWLAVVMALTVLIGGQLFINRYTRNRVLVFIVYQLAMLPMLVDAMQYNVITPDLLVVLWVLAFVFLLARSEGRLPERRKSQILLGFFCGIGFLVKGVLLPVSVVSIFAWFLLLGKVPANMGLRGRAKLLVLPMASVLFVALLWAVPLSLKYDRPTLGSSAQYSMAFIGPDAIGHPVINGLIPPSNSVAVTPWEDPTRHAYVPWNPLDSLGDFGYYLDYVFTRNLPAVLSTLAQLSPMLVGVLWGIILILLVGKVDKRHRTPLIVLSVVSVVLIGAYVASHVLGGRRYMWPVFVLSNISIAILLGSSMLYSSNLRKRYLVWIAVLFFPLFIFSTSYLSLLSASKDRGNVSFYRLAQAIKEEVEPRVKFASNNFGVSTSVSYYGDFAGYGTTQPGLSINDPQVQDALKRNDIEYYLYIERPDQPIDLTSFNVVLEEDLEFSDPPNGFPGGVYKTYLVRLK